MEFLNKLCISMAEAGHSESFRAMVMSRVVAKYTTSLENHLTGKKTMYRDRVEREAQVKARGGKSTKANWFRAGGVTTTITVPTTPGGLLATMVKKGLERCIPPGRTCTRVLEGGGRSVRSELAKPNPFPRPTCDRTDCPLAGSEDGCRERCYHEHVGYVGECTRCRVVQHGQGVAEADIVAREYDGETGRTLFTRSNQHYQDYSSHVVGNRRQGVSSWMWDHTVEAHGGQVSENHRDDYKFRIVGVFRDSLSRQIDEALRIESVEKRGKRIGDKSAEKVVSLNRKEEHYQPRLVRPNFHIS